MEWRLACSESQDPNEEDTVSAIDRIRTSVRQPERPEWEDRLERQLGMAALFAAVATVPVTILEEHDQYNPYVMAGVWIIWAIFLVEFTLLFVLARDRPAFVRRNTLNLIIVILSFPLLPATIAFVRLIRLVRIVAVMWWGIHEIERTLGRREVVHVAAAATALVLLSGEILSVLEPKTVPDGFWQGVWWAVVTVTSVGYGDVVPQTAAGRILATILMLTGLGLISTLAASISAYFIGHRDEAEVRDLTRRLDAIEAALHNLQVTIATAMPVPGRQPIAEGDAAQSSSGSVGSRD
jgi:voltage-gated potassium channel